MVMMRMRGVMGQRRMPEACGVTDRVDFVTGTFERSAGAGGAFTATRKERKKPMQSFSHIFFKFSRYGCYGHVTFCDQLSEVILKFESLRANANSSVNSCGRTVSLLPTQHRSLYHVVMKTLIGYGTALFEEVFTIDSHSIVPMRTRIRVQIC